MQSPGLTWPDIMKDASAGRYARAYARSISLLASLPRYRCDRHVLVYRAGVGMGMGPTQGEVGENSRTAIFFAPILDG